MERVIPHNIDAEQSVIGAMFLTKKALQKGLERLDGSEFYLDSHSKIFEAIKNLDAKGVEVDITTVADELNNLGFNIDKKKIKIDTDLNTLGMHLVKIVLHKDVIANINVSLIK